MILPRGRRGAVLVTALAALTLGLPTGNALARSGPKPTIVFVHGAFADASGFGAVTSRLQDRGYTVVSPANPLRGPAGDAAYVATVLKSIDGPIVLVAHSYGGAVITEAATQVANVKALVYLDALALDEGESNLDIAQRYPGAEIFDALRPLSYPQGAEFTIDPAAFHRVFAADLPARRAALQAARR
jgi:pimeloyl-ACP methyl ester carboxylesterase